MGPQGNQPTLLFPGVQSHPDASGSRTRLCSQDQEDALRAPGVQERGTHIIILRLLFRGSLDAVSQETKNRSDPQQHGEPPEQLPAEFDPLGGGGRGREGVGTVAGQDLGSASSA